MTAPKAVVVGSGPAGLVAAFSLLEAGFTVDEVLVLERRGSIAKRWNVVQLAALSLAKFDTFRASPDGPSVLSSMMEHGVLGKVGVMQSRMEARRGKAHSERSKDMDIASPCDRAVDLFVDIEGREWDAERWKARPVMPFKDVRNSLFGCPHSIYISDIEDHLHRVGVSRGIMVAFACDTELIWNPELAKYEVVVTRHAADVPQDIAILPLEERTSLGIPDVVVVAEGGGRNLLKSQGLLERHNIEIKIKSVPKVFAAALTRHPEPSKLISQSSILGETLYFRTPEQYPKNISIVSGNVISRAPRYLEMERNGQADRVPPDTWFVRLPPDDLSLERLSHNTNPQDFGIVEYKPSPALATYVQSHVRKMIGHFSTPELAAQAEIIKIARPFGQTDTVLERCGMGGNVVAFGDAARTGSFLSGMGMNSLICCDSRDLVDVATKLRSGADPVQAMDAYTGGIHRTARVWHAMTREIQTEKWPGWLPDLEVPQPQLAESKSVEPPTTTMRFKTIEGMVRYALANLVLNYTVPIKGVRVGLRRAGEWMLGGVQREDVAARARL
ncbi:hypothetical protein DFJ74DRAFT_678904 [Hyaloraphidium curvatum]|nr:hypothetical protein DFJ74DRAFT_678904 [Hyaloraphidium curvatum]